MNHRFMRTVMCCGVAVLSLGIAGAASAGQWTSADLGRSIPLWYEYRASVNDTGVIAGTRYEETAKTIEPIVSLSGSTVEVLPMPNLSGVTPAVATQGAALDITSASRVVGFRAGASNPLRQAILWIRTSSWDHRDLHPSVVSAFPEFTISAAYGLSEVSAASGELNTAYAVGYAREKISPDRLSIPVLWTITDSAITAKELPLPSPPEGSHAYGIAYSVSERDRANKRYACGGSGIGGTVGASLMTARCWDVTSPSAPTSVPTHSNLTAASGVATSVVTRVRTIDFGGTGTGEWQDKQTIAVGYMSFTSGGSAGFVWNLTTGKFDIHTAIASSYDSLLSDVAKQSYTTDSLQLNGTSGAVYHGPLVVGSGATTSGRLAATTNSMLKPAPVRGIMQTRIAASQTSAAQTDTCNMAPQLPTPTDVENISGVSRNAVHLVGYSDGRLYRYTSAVHAATIKVYERNARVYGGVGGAAVSDVRYHWATVAGQPNAQVFWSNAAGCDNFSSGIACPSDMDSPIGAKSGARVSGAFPEGYVYVRAANLDDTSCKMTPVYSLAQLGGVVVNPGPNLDTDGASETWADCGGSSAPSARPRTGGYNVNTQSDYYHCGSCGVSADDSRTCTDDRCEAGARQSKASGVGCWIGGSSDWTSVLWGQGACVPSSQVNPNNQCQQCSPSTNASGWSSRPNGTTCSTNDCRANEKCTGGACGGGNWIVDGYEPNDLAGSAKFLSGPDGRSFHEDDPWSRYRELTDLTIFTESGSGNDEDWFWFWSDDWYRDYCHGSSWGFPNGAYGGSCEGELDDSGAGDQPQPRVMLFPPANVDLELCMYIECANGSSATINNRYRGTSMQNTSTSYNPHPNGYPGVCSRGGAGAVEDLELHWNCSGTNETARVWVKVYKFSGTTTCRDKYTLRWGNDL